MATTEQGNEGVDRYELNSKTLRKLMRATRIVIKDIERELNGMEYIKNMFSKETIKENKGYQLTILKMEKFLLDFQYDLADLKILQKNSKELEAVNEEVLKYLLSCIENRFMEYKKTMNDIIKKYGRGDIDKKPYIGYKGKEVSYD